MPKPDPQTTAKRAEFWCPLSPTGTVDVNTRGGTPDDVWNLMTTDTSGYVRRAPQEFYTDGFRIIRVQVIEVECADGQHKSDTTADLILEALGRYSDRSGAS